MLCLLSGLGLDGLGPCVGFGCDLTAPQFGCGIRYLHLIDTYVALEFTMP